MEYLTPWPFSWKERHDMRVAQEKGWSKWWVHCNHVDHCSRITKDSRNLRTIPNMLTDQEREPSHN